MFEKQDLNDSANYEYENVVVLSRIIRKSTQHKFHRRIASFNSPDFLLPLLILLHFTFMKSFL
jgi:hypothetical protein